MTQEEVVECILQKGHEVAVHGSNHRAEGTLRPIEGIRDVLDNRLELEQTYGTSFVGWLTRTVESAISQIMPATKASDNI